MNDSTNTPQPKKSFWAKLFGGKDTNTQAPTENQPVVVPPSNPSVSSTDQTPVVPPQSELGQPAPIAPSEEISSPQPVTSEPTTLPQQDTSFPASDPISVSPVEDQNVQEVAPITPPADTNPGFSNAQEASSSSAYTTPTQETAPIGMVDSFATPPVDPTVPPVSKEPAPNVFTPQEQTAPNREEQPPQSPQL